MVVAPQLIQLNWICTTFSLCIYCTRPNSFCMYILYLEVYKYLVCRITYPMFRFWMTNKQLIINKYGNTANELFKFFILKQRINSESRHNGANNWNNELTEARHYLTLREAKRWLYCVIFLFRYSNLFVLLRL